MERTRNIHAKIGYTLTALLAIAVIVCAIGWALAADDANYNYNQVIGLQERNNELTSSIALLQKRSDELSKELNNMTNKLTNAEWTIGATKQQYDNALAQIKQADDIIESVTKQNCYLCWVEESAFKQTPKLFFGTTRMEAFTQCVNEYGSNCKC